MPTRPAGLTVLVITPKLAGAEIRPLEPTFSDEPGCPYCARLKRLKASARR